MLWQERQYRKKPTEKVHLFYVIRSLEKTTFHHTQQTAILHVTGFVTNYLIRI